MKKIIIFYASFGGGHLSAARSIEDYLKNNYDDLDIELIDCMKYVNKTFEKVSTSAYKQMAKNMPWVWGKIYNDAHKGPLAHITSRANSVMAIKLLKLLREKKPDIIVSTHPFSSQMCTYLKRKGKISAKIATILTDFKSHDQWLIGSEHTDFFFVANDNMKQELIEKSIASDKIFITGIPIRKEFLEKHDKKEILRNLNFSEDKKTILLFGGGEYGLGKNLIMDVFDSICANFSDIQVIVISGKNENIKKAFTKKVLSTNRTHNIKIFGYTDKVAEFMAISDLVISKPGGLTTTESLVSNVPMIIVNPIPGQEEENAEFLENKNVGKWLKKGNDVDFYLKIILNDDNMLNTMKENTKLLAKPNSTKDICEIILK